MQYQLEHGDCLAVLRTMPDNSVDSVVCDPPYGLSFMGKRWDYDVREEIPERRRALKLWADYLVGCENSTPPSRDDGANVVRLRGVA